LPPPIYVRFVIYISISDYVKQKASGDACGTVVARAVMRRRFPISAQSHGRIELPPGARQLLEDARSHAGRGRRAGRHCTSARAAVA
jgi:hypothetical protein